MPSTVAFRYAAALADTIQSPGAAKPVRDPNLIGAQLAEFKDFVAQNRELQVVFSTPAISSDKKKAILSQVTAGMALEPMTTNFLSVVIDHKRMDLLGEITEAFQVVLNERLGMAEAQIATARPLAEADQKSLAAALAARTGKQIRMNFSLDPSLIGGVVARIGSTIYDGSVREHLRVLRARLSSQ